MSKTRRKQQAKRARSRRRNARLFRFGLPFGVVAGVVVMVLLIKNNRTVPLTHAQLIAKGEKKFLQVCAQCHGGDLQGSAMAPSFFSTNFAPSQLPDDSIRSAIKNGVQPHIANFGPMPPQPRVHGSDVDAVIAYIRSQQAAAGIDK